jgi:hypothetical protein
MSLINNIIKKVEAGINTFVSVCINANRDLPFHDFCFTGTTDSGMYAVGSNNISGVGDQKKHFVSKSTLIFSSFNLGIKINSQNNIQMLIFANTYYEFKSNIHSIFWGGTGEQDTYIKIWFEGVMYNEARRPE